MTPVRSYSWVLAFGTVLLCAATAFGTRKVRAAEGAPAAPHLAAKSGGLQRFQTSDQAELLMLLDDLAPERRDARPGERAPENPDARQEARLVSELLAAGQPDVVTDHALESLGRLGVREGRDALVTYTHHRRVDARRRAYTALARLRDPALAATLSEGLRDSAPEVRASAAQALGELRASSATPLLLRALGRGVTEAAPALGKLGDAASVEPFGAYLGRQPLSAMLAGYADYLQRDDIPESVKLRIVATLEDVSGPAVKAFLAEQLAKPKTARSPQLQRALSASLARIQVAPRTETAK